MSTTFGDKLKSLRIDKRITQEELANYLSVKRATLANWEVNRTSPDMETLNKLADFFDVSLDYLLGRADKEKAPLQGSEGLLDHPLLADLLKRVPNLTEEETESLASHLEVALQLIERKRKEKSNN